MKNDPYKKSGVYIKAGNDLVDKIRKDVASTFDKNVLGGIGSFSGFYYLPKGFKNPVRKTFIFWIRFTKKVCS